VIFRATKISGVVEIELEPQADERGMFARAYCEDEFRAQGLKPVGVQCNISRNKQRHTLRGLHYQAEPVPEAKLVRCIAGRVFDVAVDLRKDSPTFLDWVSVELDAAHGNMLYVDEGCAHGFMTLTDGATVFYQMGAAYQPKLARGVRWSDPRFAIAWPAPPVAISERDAGFPDFRT
jgi:dTDP-4-dehydrorhamnose 3,5-epimerase